MGIQVGNLGEYERDRTPKAHSYPDHMTVLIRSEILI